MVEMLKKFNNFCHYGGYFYSYFLDRLGYLLYLCSRKTNKI